MKTTMETTSDPVKILKKGPEYLRKQMDIESETTGPMSAVERLAASKTKFVKSQQVANSSQDPLIFGFGSASVSSTESSNWSSKRGGNLVTVKNRVKEDTCCDEPNGPQVQVRRTCSAKRDSLLIYRQKSDLKGGSLRGQRRHHLARRQLQRSRKRILLPEAANKESEAEGNKAEIATPEATGKECSSLGETCPPRDGLKEQKGTENEDSGEEVETSVVKKSAGLLTVPEVERRPGKGVSRSHSDISSRYSKNFADFDAFFKYCGLDGQVVESLGKQNFSALSDEIVKDMRSISISSSDDGFSRNSGDSDGLMEETLHKKIRQTTSVIERNARIIKWLYSCRNAKETGKKLRDLD